jgi:UDP-N-acetylglucosamine--N-acetylmuramyl-(pentapeptide) pyrophosphoryl-undecaprenol N-acetylglucosamine transferase
LISAGGTGGGVYPALAVAEAIHTHDATIALRYVGSQGMERGLITRSAAPDLFTSYDDVQSGPLNGVSMLRRVQSVIKIGVGTLQALRLVRRYRPQALLITGGWATFPVAVACRLLGVPVAIFLPDIEPGVTIKGLSRLAKVIYATSVESQTYFPKMPGKVIETGYPLRAQVLNATRAAGIAHFNLDPDRRTLLVFGGSRGARSLNLALATILPTLIRQGLQVIHIAGETDWSDVQVRQAALSVDERSRYQVFPYLHEDMGLALAAADLTVSRAGASALGEFPQFGIAAILVPYPFAWRYQKVNADWLAARGAAIRLNDEDLADKLLPTIQALLTDSVRLDSMRKQSAALAKPDSARIIAEKLITLKRG